MASRSAIIKGTFLRPVTSGNKRTYTAGNISDAVARMQERIASPEGWKLSMATSHGAAYSDDALSTIGRVTKVEQLSDGSATWEADIANTAAGRDIANLAHGGYIKGVSIRGKWMSDPYEMTAESGEKSVTADKMDVMGIDFTGNPGVEGAQVTDVQLMESLGDPNVFVESIEDVEVLIEEVEKPAETGLFSEAATSLAKELLTEATQLARQDKISVIAEKINTAEAVINADDDMADSGTVTCSSCGANAPPNAMYCPQCGSVIVTAESEESAPNQTKEPLVADETVTEASTEEVSEQESTVSVLTDSDVTRIAAALAEAMKPAPVEVAAAEEVVAEEVVAEEVAPEKTVAEQVAEQVAIQMAEIRTQASEAATAEAIKLIRDSGAASRKGLVEDAGTASEQVTEAASTKVLDSRELAKISANSKQEADHLMAEALKSDEFFGSLFKRLDANAARQYGV